MDLDNEELKATKNLFKERGEKQMYVMKKKYSDLIKKNRSNRKIANVVGITEPYMSGIVNNDKRRSITKMTAYAITKAIDENLEIADVFDLK